MIRRIIRWTMIALALLILLVVILTAATPQGRTAFRVMLFLPQVLTGIPIKPQEWVTRSPVHQEIQFPLAEGVGEADLYMPADSGQTQRRPVLLRGGSPIP